jgi:hypothetical protein
MFNRLTPSLICIAVAIVAAPAIAKNQLDFNYRVSGDAKVRPILVFNDGQDVYVQPNPETVADIRIVGAVAEKEGPYFVIRGLTDSFSVQMKKGGTAEVSYKGSSQRTVQKTPNIAPAYLQPVQPTAQAPVLAPAPAPVVAKPALDVPKAAEVKSQPVPDRARNEFVAKAPACVPRIDSKESAFVVTFPAKASKMSANAEVQLKMAVTDGALISMVEITAEDAQDNMKLAAQRATAIGAIVASQGVAKSKIRTKTRESTGVGSEMRVVRETVIPCKGGGIKLDYRDSGHVSLVADADVKPIIVQLALEAKLSLSIEGSDRQIPVSIDETNKPLISILEIIGSKLGNKADLVYRGKALVLRYRTVN